MFDLLRRFRRHRRLSAEAARLKLKDPNLTRWGRRIMDRAVARLERDFR